MERTRKGPVKAVADATKEASSFLEAKQNIVTGKIVSLAESLGAIISPFVEVQDAAIELAKSVGLAGKSIMSNSMTLIEQNRKMQLSRQYGISNKEMMDLQMKVMGGLGRNVQIDQLGTAIPGNPNFDSEIQNLVAANQVFGADKVAEIVAGYDALGLSMKTAAKATGKLYKEAGEYGINLTKYTENFTKNLRMAQMYNFRNGVNGLKEMARKATEIRQDMGQIAKFADKVGSVTGAVETAANLQVLGGSFSALANPLTMLNKSLTDVNGLQEMLNGMTEGAATYNSVTHEIEMDPVTRQIMKRAAESMGVDPTNLIDQAYAQARRTEITRQMNGIGNLTDEFKKMAPNIGTIDEYGRAGVTVNGEFKAFSDIAAMNADAQENLLNQVVEENRSKDEDIKVIAKDVMGIRGLIAGVVGDVTNEAARSTLMPGIANGKSTNDLIVDMLTRRIDPKAIAGGAKIDRIITNALANWENLNISGLNEILKPLNANNTEDAIKQVGDAIASIFPDPQARDASQQFAFKIVDWLKEKTKDFSLGDYGVTLGEAWGSREHEGRKGSAPFAPAAAAQSRDSVALAARDVSVEATNFNLNGGENARIQTAEGTEISRATAAIQGDTNQILETVQTIESNTGRDTTLPVTTTTEGASVTAQAVNSVALTARDVLVQATNLNLKAEEGAQRQAITGVEELNGTTTTIQSDNDQIWEALQTLASRLGYSTTAPIVTAGGTATEPGQDRNSIILTARDVLVQAVNLRLNGERNTENQPLTEAGDLKQSVTSTDISIQPMVFGFNGGNTQTQTLPGTTGLNQVSTARDIFTQPTGFNFNGENTQARTLPGTTGLNQVSTVRNIFTQPMVFGFNGGNTQTQTLPGTTGLNQVSAARDVFTQPMVFGFNGGNIQPQYLTGIEPNGVSASVFKPIQPMNFSPNGGNIQPRPLTKAGELNRQITNSVALVARDVLMQAENFSLAGGENIQIQPLSETGELNRASAAIQSDNSQIWDMVQALTSGLNYPSITPLGLATENGQTVTEFFASPTSVPNIEVAPNRIQASTGLQGADGWQNGSDGQTIYINVSGTISVANNDKKFDIPEEEIRKIILRALERSPQFRQGMGKTLGDSYAETDKRFGLTSV